MTARDQARAERRAHQHLASRSFRRAQDAAFAAHNALADILERDETIAALDAEHGRITATARARGHYLRAEEARLSELTALWTARRAELEKDTLARSKQAWRRAEHVAGGAS